MNARVSVIISTYNRKDLLKKAIRSVLDQSMVDFELIIVDDCSTQDIQTLTKSYGDPRIKYFKTEQNSGHDSLPKNLGISRATGEYVCFLDDDDTYRKDALKVLTRYAEESKAEVVYADYLIDGKPGWSIDFSGARLAQHNYISMIVTLVKREALLKVGGFDQDVPKFKDWNLWLRLHKSGAAFLHIPIIIAEAVNSVGGISDSVKVDTDAEGRYLPTFFNPADCKIFPENTLLGKRKPLKIAVYTLTMNRLEYTKQMYEALDTTAGYLFDSFIIDQGSTDGTKEWIKSLTRDSHNLRSKGYRERLIYRLYPANVGLAKGWNNIVDFIKSEGEYDIIIKVDNDAELMTAGWLKAMVEIFERNRRLILSPYVEGLDGSPGGVLRQRASGESPYLMINDTVLGSVPNLGGIVFATPIELWKTWPGFDEKGQGNKDYVFSMYAKQQGYSLFYMEEYRVWHIDGTKGQQAKFPDYFRGRPDVEESEEDLSIENESVDNGVVNKEPEIEYPEPDEEFPDSNNLL